MIPAKIDSFFIEIITNLKGGIEQITAGNFLKGQFLQTSSIYHLCPFLDNMLEALPLKESTSIEGMLIVAEKQEYNVDINLFRNDNNVVVLIHDCTNNYKSISQLNQNRNDLFFLKRELQEKNEELLKLRKLADKANEEKTRFLAMMSHEVRNPLNSILGFTKMISEEKLTKKSKIYINYLSIAGNNLKVIVDDILDLSRIEAGKLELVSEKISIQNILKNCFVNLKNQQENKQVKLKLKLTGLPKKVFGDNVRLYQVISNLCGNSLKFTEKGIVEIQASVIAESESKLEVRFKVKDTGRGMTAEQTTRIFEEYQQTEVDDQRVHGGAGLGLSIVKRLVEAMQGSIAIDSSVGIGTTFIIDIPFLKAEKKKSKKKTKSKKVKKVTLKADLKDKRILIVDDDLLNQRITSHFLKKELAQIEVAKDGAEALEFLKSYSFDAVLLDINLPDITGDQLVIQKENFKKNSSIPFIALTGNATKSQIKKYLKIGFSEVVTKPYQPENLIHILASSIKE